MIIVVTRIEADTVRCIMCGDATVTQWNRTSCRTTQTVDNAFARQE